MPRTERARLARDGRRASATRQRLLRFRAYLDRLPRRMTREDLSVVLYDVWRSGYLSGQKEKVAVRRSAPPPVGIAEIPSLASGTRMNGA